MDRGTEIKPLVSVIMPCFNTEAFIAKSIETVLKQRFEDWELIIVDDASTDGTVDVITPYTNDPRIKLYLNETHAGIAASRNKAIQNAKGKYLSFLDADDLWKPEKLEQQVNWMRNNQCGFSYTSYQCINEDNELLPKIISAKDLCYSTYLKNTLIGTSTVMIDREMCGEVVVPNFRTSEDMATWLNILRQGKKAYAITDILTYYRVRRHSASSNKIKAACDVWTVYRRQEKLSLYQSGMNFIHYAWNALKKHLR